MVTKKQKSILESVDSMTDYSLSDAVKILQEHKSPKFDESLDVAIKLGVDGNKSDQNVRGSFIPPHGLGKKVQIAVFAQGKAADEAKAAGVKYVGGDDLIEKIKNGDMNFEKLICSSSMMIKLSKLGKVLGPKGLMPNPKLGTVTEKIGEAVKNAKAGQVEIKNDKDGNIGLSIGKKSFSDEKLIKNFNAVISSLEKEKSNLTIKGDLIKSTYITSTMGVSYKIKLEKSF